MQSFTNHPKIGQGVRDIFAFEVFDDIDSTNFKIKSREKRCDCYRLRTDNRQQKNSVKENTTFISLLI